jgi:hypothetical protein
MFAMASPIPRRLYFTPLYAADLRFRAERRREANQARRLLALAAVCEVGLQIVRDWVVRFTTHGPEGLIDRKAPGAAPKLNEAPGPGGAGGERPDPGDPGRRALTARRSRARRVGEVPHLDRRISRAGTRVRGRP